MNKTRPKNNLLDDGGAYRALNKLVTYPGYDVLSFVRRARDRIKQVREWWDELLDKVILVLVGIVIIVGYFITMAIDVVFGFFR